MASQGYWDWLRAGKPYTLIRPAKALQTILKAHGLTVWDFPDEGHQKAEPPQDHTPYSATGWPGANARWNARALDVMPRDGGAAAAKENADIARQLIRDRNAGVPGVMWIKYINWTDENGRCRQVRWTPSYEVRDSGDKDHIHISGRSDVDNDNRADNYDPIARMTGGGLVATSWDTTLKCGDGGVRPLWQIALDLWNGMFQSGGPKIDTDTGGYAVSFPLSLSAQVAEVLTAVKTIETGGQLPSPPADRLSDEDVERIAVRTVELFAARLSD